MSLQRQTQTKARKSPSSQQNSQPEVKQVVAQAEAQGEVKTRKKRERHPQLVFLRSAKNILSEVFDVPDDSLMIRKSPFKKVPTLYIYYNEVELSVANKEDLKRVIASLVVSSRQGATS